MYRRIALVFAALLTPVLLSACSPTSTMAPTTQTTSPAPGVSTPTPSADPTPISPPLALASDCTQLLTAASIADFDGSGFGIPDAASITAYVDKTRAEGSPLALFVDGGGLLCPISNGTRVSELFGYSPITPEVAAEQKARLIAEGFAVSTHGSGELYSDTSGHDGVVFVYLFAGDYWFCAIDIARLDEVVANSGAAV